MKHCATMNNASPYSRRNFIKKSAASVFGFTFLPAYLTAARDAKNPALPPSQRINLVVLASAGGPLEPSRA
jgi:hypothetical protein